MFVDTNGEWQAAMVGPHHPLKEPFYCGNIPFGTEHELYCIAFSIQGAVQVLLCVKSSLNGHN